MLKSGVRGSNLLKCSREQIGIKRAKVRCAPRRPLKGHRSASKSAKVRCAPRRSQKGHRSAGGANVLKLVGRGAEGPGTKTAKVWRAPLMSSIPRCQRRAPRDARADQPDGYAGPGRLSDCTRPDPVNQAQSHVSVPPRRAGTVKNIGRYKQKHSNTNTHLHVKGTTKLSLAPRVRLASPRRPALGGTSG